MQNILIICGGRSAEHEVSLVSAYNVIHAMDKIRFCPIIVIVARSGTWHWVTMDRLEAMIALPGHFGKEDALCTLVRTNDGVILQTINESSKRILIDCAFPLIHGPMGEDGTIQGFFEILSLAYVGSGVASSAINMDKDLMKKLFIFHQIPTVPHQCIHQHGPHLTYNDACAALKSTILFVKPASLGSSVGVNKVVDEATYNLAVKQALCYCTKVIVEAAVPQCREFECAILGNNEPQAATVVGEISVNPTHLFYSYDAKYNDPKGAELGIPAAISDTLTQSIRSLALRAFTALECKGMARVDLFLSLDGKIYVNEINTLPGFTAISMYPKLWEASGIGYQELVTRLILLALENHTCSGSLRLTP